MAVLALRNGSEAALLSQMDRYAITCAVVSSLKGVFSDPDAGNREVLQLARAHPDRFLPALTYSPHAAGRDRYAEDFDGLPSGIVKLFPVQHTYDPLEETYIHELLTFCEIRHIPVMIPYRLMMSWRFPVFDLKKMALVIASFPAVRFIIASINYLAELQSAIHILHNTNAYINSAMMISAKSNPCPASGRTGSWNLHPLQIRHRPLENSHANRQGRENKILLRMQPDY